MMTTTFDDARLPDITITWAGGATFNIWHKGWNVDVFTFYGDDKGNPPDANKAREVVCERFDALASGEWELYDGRGYRVELRIRDGSS